ncbi:hypothetical protein QJS10_CPB15g02107 [Acorus calamus]|uniref:Uncharacterized protein n=1 Tax=Acorus calamus TaxID=4465 RepID=A0AAV9D5Z1_ACOCL|nr:hypothetical protein QJS10_CPB15g02107 [Acorus calamus]
MEIKKTAKQGQMVYHFSFPVQSTLPFINVNNKITVSLAIKANENMGSPVPSNQPDKTRSTRYNAKELDQHAINSLSLFCFRD